MGSICTIVRRFSDRIGRGLAAAGLAVAAVAAAMPSAAVAIRADAPGCKGRVYLTLDTGNMRHAELIASILARHRVRATFFLANERTDHPDASLEARWHDFWRARVAEGHAFGSHTFDHVYFSAAPAGPTARVTARPQFGAGAGRPAVWDRDAVCGEIDRVDARFREITGRSLDRFWRAPGGKGPRILFDLAQSCGWRHVGWSPAGFLGDELPSDRFPNDALLAQALASIRAGDILMAHLGIWSRRNAWAPTLDPLIAGLKRRGLCFGTIPEHPAFGGAAG